VTQLQNGEVLAEKYQVERVLGQGGMGVVLAARHLHLGERVAIKLMHPQAAILPDAVARFIREARAAARLESAHVARVTDVGVLEDQRPYMVMEYLEGTDLEALLASSGPLPIETAVDYVLQAAEAIAEAHLLGIVHRDLKPSNLFLVQRRDGQPLIKVLDFGISKVVDETQGGMTTTTSSLMGSPLYMSPEQLTAQRDVDGRSDVWAIGVILFELVSGSPPFAAETLPQLCAHILQLEPDALRARRHDAPVELERVITRCLQKSPQARYQNVLELSLALQGLASEMGRVSVERISRLAGVSRSASSTRSSFPVAYAEGASAEQPRARWRIVVGALALLSLGAAATVALRARTTAAPPQTHSTPLPPPPQMALPVLADTAPAPPPGPALAPASSAASAVASSKTGLRPKLVKRPAPAPSSPPPLPARSAEPKAPVRAPRDFGGRL
jgi:serine/threonine-protein kinase